VALTVEEVRRRQREGGKRGAYTKLALFGRPDPWAPTEARRVYRESFAIAHGGDPRREPWASMPKAQRPIGLCRWCPTRVELAANLSDEERAYRAQNLRSAHYKAMSDRAVARRRATG
jgi:hypothetical protein